MQPAWAGADGNWPAIDEVFDPKVVQQQDNLSCGAACGQMLALPPRWAGGPLGIPEATQTDVFDALMTTGSWIAMLWETGAKIGHMVIVDALDRQGYVLIRDPWQGTRYKLKKEDFLNYWSDYGVYRRK